jgi:hypothetical protein
LVRSLFQSVRPFCAPANFLGVRQNSSDRDFFRGFSKIAARSPAMGTFRRPAGAGSRTLLQSRNGKAEIEKFRLTPPGAQLEALPPGAPVGDRLTAELGSTRLVIFVIPWAWGLLGRGGLACTRGGCAPLCPGGQQNAPPKWSGV